MKTLRVNTSQKHCRYSFYLALVEHYVTSSGLDKCIYPYVFFSECSMSTVKSIYISQYEYEHVCKSINLLLVNHIER